MAIPDSMRTSDAERDQVLDRLREALVEGRLDSDEFDERATATLAAKTHGQLRVLTADLPPGPTRPLVALVKSRPVAGPAVPGAAGRMAILRSMSWGWFPVFVICSLIWLATAHGGPFWPAWLLFWAAFSFHGRSRGRRHDGRRRQQAHAHASSRERLER